MDSQQVLVILLSAGFIVLIVLSIIFMYILIRIVRSVRRIAQRAEDTTEDMSAVVKEVGKRLAPAALSALALAALKKFRTRKEK